MCSKRIFFKCKDISTSCIFINYIPVLLWTRLNRNTSSSLNKLTMLFELPACHIYKFKTVPGFSPMHKEANELCIIYPLIHRSVL